MKRPILRRPSPGTAIASLALFVSLGGVSYGVASGSIDSREIKNNTVQTQDVRNGAIRTQDVRNDTLRTEDLRNNEVRGVDIRNSTVRTSEVAIDSLNGQDIDESTLQGVNAATLGGTGAGVFAKGSDLGRFSVKLSGGESVTLATHGSISVVANCLDNSGGFDTVQLLAATSANGAVMAGEDSYTGTGGSFLNASTTPGDRQLLARERANAASALVDKPQNGDDGFVVGPDGRGLHISSEATALGFNYAGGACFAAGVLEKTG